MTTPVQAISGETQAFAQDLFELIEAMDPARWRDELEPALRARAAALYQRLQDLVERSEISADPRFVALRDRLSAVSEPLQTLPDVSSPATRLRSEWDSLRTRLQPVYEELAAALRSLNAEPLPSLRPTNYARNLFHVGNGLMCILLIQHVLTPLQMILVSGAFTVLGWTFEVSRRRFEAVNRFLMWILGPFAHPHERHRINSSTWFTTALLILALTSTPLAVSVALAVLAVGDPMAALIGRRYGRTPLVNRRSLEGSLAFVATGAAAAFLVLRIYYPAISAPSALLFALLAALFGAIAELFCSQIDDNLAIPVAAAAGAGLVGLWL